MPTRLQALKFGLGIPKQANISTIATPATAFQTFRKLDMEVPTLQYNTETDKDEIGKGNEFINQVFPTNFDVAGRMEKYGSAEFMLWSWAYALGVVPAPVGGLYTINPIDPGTTLELPYFSMAVQLAEGGGEAVDEAYIGMAIEDVETTFKYGPSRASLHNTVSYVGSGLAVFPSGVTYPAALAENYMYSSSMAISINGVDYVSSKTMLQGSIGWKNNLILPMRYFPGSGMQTLSLTGAIPAAIGGRILIGARVPTLSFTAFLQHDSLEYTKLCAQTTGTATITFTYDATHYITFTFHSVSFERVERTQEEGIVAVTVTCAPKWDPTGTPANGVLTVTGKCGLANIAQ